MLIGDCGQQGLEPTRFHLVHVAARGAKQELALVGMVGMVARQVGLGGLQAVNEADAHEEVEVSVDGQRRDLPLLALLQQGDEFVGGERSVALQHLRVDR